ncbi:MAG: hypothetical protein QM790_15805 [Nibricoccus sp.]
MKISKLLASHKAIMKQARLAAQAQAYLALSRYSERVRRAGIIGRVHLRHPDADEGIFWATLVALDGAQSVIEEHFSDEDVMELADAVALVCGVEQLDVVFPIEAIEEKFVKLLRRELRKEGVTFDLDAQEIKAKRRRYDAPASAEDKQRLRNRRH